LRSEKGCIAGDRAAPVVAFYRALCSHKREAMDFFARTEMDKHTLDAHSEYKRAVEAFVTHLAAKKTLDEFANTDHYWAIRP
jgi:hypothetical protein